MKFFQPVRNWKKIKISNEFECGFCVKTCFIGNREGGHSENMDTKIISRSVALIEIGIFGTFWGR